MNDSIIHNELDIENLFKLPSDDGMIRNLLFESLNREKELKRLLNDQLIINDKMRLELELERRKTCIKGFKKRVLFLKM